MNPTQLTSRTIRLISAACALAVAAGLLATTDLMARDAYTKERVHNAEIASVRAGNAQSL